MGSRNGLPEGIQDASLPLLRRKNKLRAATNAVKRTRFKLTKESAKRRNIGVI